MLLNCGVGEDSWESLGLQEIQSVHPKGNQSWVFTGKTDVEAETLMATSCKELTHLKRPWCWERLRAGGEGDDRGWDGWMASLTQWIWVWVNSRSWWCILSPRVLPFMRSLESDMTEWTELKETKERYTENYDTNERNQRWHKQMERYYMFLGRKN